MPARGSSIASGPRAARTLEVAEGAVRVVMQAPAWGPSGEYLERTLTPLLSGLRVHHYAVRNTPGGEEASEPDSQAARSLAADLDAERVALGAESLAITAHSQGTVTALAYAVRYPERVAALVLLGPSLVPPSSTLMAAELLHRFAQDPDRRAAVEWLESHPRSRESIVDDRSLARWMRATAPLSFFDLGAMRRFQRALRDMPPPRAHAFHRTPEAAEEWIRRGLSSVVTPTLAIAGRYDFVTAIDAAEEAIAEIRGARLLVVDRAGHNPWIERPGAVSTAIRGFLADFL